MKIRVLIFDDEESIRKLFKIMLNDREYEIHDFSDPSTCPLYDKAECECPLNEMCADIIITDIRMPEVNGIEFIRKQKEKGCKVNNILVISAYIDGISEIEIENLGCACLRKPFSPKQLNDIMDRFEENINPDRKLAEWEDIEVSSSE